MAAGEDPSAAVRFKAALALGGRRGRDILVDLARGHGADDASGRVSLPAEQSPTGGNDEAES